METSERSVFLARAAAVAAVVSDAGVTLHKSPHAFELIAEGANGRISFPIVSDERDWRQTTPEEAFYALLLDAHEWAGAQLDDSSPAFASASAVGPVTDVPIMRREEATAIQRLQALAALLGGDDRLNAAFNAAGLSPLAIAT